MTSAISISPANTTCRSIPVVPAGRWRRSRDRLRGLRRPTASWSIPHFLDGLAVPEAKRAVDRPAGKLRPASARSPIGCATGACRASAIGAARSRSSIARPAASCRCRQGPAGQAARGRQLRPAGQPARPPPDLEARQLPELRRQGDARDRHVRHVLRILLVFRALLLAARRPGVRSRRRSTTGCRSTSISAASSMRCCICSIRASSPGR